MFIFDKNALEIVKDVREYESERKYLVSLLDILNWLKARKIEKDTFLTSYKEYFNQELYDNCSTKRIKDIEFHGNTREINPKDSIRITIYLENYLGKQTHLKDRDIITFLYDVKNHKILHSNYQASLIWIILANNMDLWHDLSNYAIDKNYHLTMNDAFCSPFFSVDQLGDRLIVWNTKNLSRGDFILSSEFYNPNKKSIITKFGNIELSSNILGMKRILNTEEDLTKFYEHLHIRDEHLPEFISTEIKRVRSLK